MAIQYRPDSAASPSHVSYEIRERHTAVSYERELIRRRRTERNVVVEGIEIELQAITAIPLGFVANELITNAAKYSTGRITVSLEVNREKGYTLSVCNDGSGLPEGFDPAARKGLGMRIIRSLVDRIGAELRIDRGDGNQGPRFTVLFS